MGSFVIEWVRQNGVVLLFPALVVAALFLPSEPTGLSVGDSVPQDASVRLLGGDEQSLFGAEKPTVLEFWASWCSPCRQSVPALNRVAYQYRDRVSVVAINVEGHLSPSEVATRTEDFGYQVAVAKAPSSIQTDFEVSHLPTLLVVHEGRVTYRHAGVVDEDALEEHLRTLVDTAL